jgi:hypothetical protein
MADYCLVHGGWHGGRVWKRVARHLREEGRDVYRPTMTGLGRAQPSVERDNKPVDQLD